MSDPTILDFTVKALLLVLLSLVQALTQVQEQTLSFAVKLVAVTVTILLTARWLGDEIYTFAQMIFDSFGKV
jgi:type III secretion protein S